jgi:hypothetical protein
MFESSLASSGRSGSARLSFAGGLSVSVISPVVYRATATGASTPRHIARDQPADLPAILLGRMAVERRHQGNGLGAAMLEQFITKAIEVSEIVGVRLVLVHAKGQQAKGFYRHYGFVESPIDTLTLMMLLPSTSRDARCSSSSGRVLTLRSESAWSWTWLTASLTPRRLAAV